MTDTHTHIYMPEFDGDAGSYEERIRTVRRALDAGVDRMIFPGIDFSSLEPMAKVREMFPDNISVAVGLHPTEVDESWLEECRKIFSSPLAADAVAVGEIGIDLYWDDSRRGLQKEAFAFQLGEAMRRDLPVIVHQRSALDDVLEVIAASGIEPSRVVMHSFTGTPADAARILEGGDFYFGINGVATFRNAPELREALRLIPPSRLLLETDSPYLAPVPKRGRRNESSYLPFVAATVAEVLGMTSEEAGIFTARNASSFFKIN